jgi:hypothetical protein
MPYRQLPWGAGTALAAGVEVVGTIMRKMAEHASHARPLVNKAQALLWTPHFSGLRLSACKAILPQSTCNNPCPHLSCPLDVSHSSVVLCAAKSMPSLALRRSTVTRSLT